MKHASTTKYLSQVHCLRTGCCFSTCCTPQISTHCTYSSRIIALGIHHGFKDVGAVVLCCDFKDYLSNYRHTNLVVSSFIGTTKKQLKKEGGSYQEIDYDLNHQLIDIAKTHNSAFVYLSSMGVEWAKWNAYLQARYLVEQELQKSSLSYAIIRPGILSGSRDHSRPAEEVGAWFSHRLANLYQKVGLQNLADGTKPLDAPEVADFVMRIFENTLIIQADQNVGIFIN